MTEHAAPRIVVLGVGMVTALGLDAATACAAARAGLSRAAPMEHMMLKAPDGEVMGVVGHCAPMITAGFEGSARLSRLAQAGLLDLRRDLRRAFDRGTALYLAVPDPLRRWTGSALLPTEAVRADYHREAALLRDPHTAGTLATEVIAQATATAKLEGTLDLRHATACGQCGVAVALQAAASDLAAGRVETAVVGGVDSLIGEPTLQWLNDCGRLKTPAIAAGLQPGEAAAFLALALETSASPETPALARIEGLQFARESHALLDGFSPLGDGLAQVMLANSITANWPGEAQPWLLSDHNGESYRAYDWGHACARLRHTHAGLADAAPWYPAEAFGDTGAASGAVAIVTVVSAWRRGYAPATAATVLSSADGCERSALRLRRPVH